MKRKSIYQEVIDELKELNGDLSSLHTTTRTYTPIPPIKAYSPAEIKVLREQGRYTQTLFGNKLFANFNVPQVRGVERPAEHGNPAFHYTFIIP